MSPHLRSRRPVRPLVTSVDDVTAHVAAALRLGPPGTVGAELEWFAVDPHDPLVRPPLERVSRALAGVVLPGGSLLSTEPGGQVELSSLPLPGPQAATDALTADLAAVRAALGPARVELRGGGADPVRPPERLVDSTRYACMEAFFRADGGDSGAAGLAMMCSTAAVQVSVDAGQAGSGVQSATARWQRAHAVGPALVAAFACSPVLHGAPTGWRSTRQRVWSRIDPTRTRAPRPGLGPVDAVTELALGARLLTVRDADGVCRPAPPLTFGEWIAGALGTAPTEDDLAYHLTTLFPPVRARGWYELRYLDGLPDPLWRVAVGVAAALLDDDRAADAARDACQPVEGRWSAAARAAVGDPELRRAAAVCLAAAADALPRLAAPRLAAEVAAYADRFTARGRCPADDVLDGVCPSPATLQTTGVPR